MKIEPYGRKIVVRPEPKGPAVTHSGIYLGDPNEKLVWGTVEEIGDQARNVRVGQSVLFNLLLAREVGDVYVLSEDGCYLVREAA
jgi:co-chaperonin GroES (HSP10)